MNVIQFAGRFGEMPVDVLTIATAPSAIMPMPMASPLSDMRFALRPCHFMRIKAKSAAGGRTSGTMT